MDTLFKLTTQDNKTRVGNSNETTWGAGVTNTAGFSGKQLCSREVIHAYRSPLIALLLNPVHANIHNPKLWRAAGEVVAELGEKTRQV